MAKEKCKHTCATCGQMRLSAGTCIDMTCYIGYHDGNHDGWIKPQKVVNEHMYSGNDTMTIGDLIKK